MGDNTERADAFRSGGLGLTSRKYSDAELEELKDRNPCDKIAGQWVSLRRHGKKFIGPCPIHSPDLHHAQQQAREAPA
jgi:hypothetical protein